MADDKDKNRQQSGQQSGQSGQQSGQSGEGQREGNVLPDQKQKKSGQSPEEDENESLDRQRRAS